MNNGDYWNEPEVEAAEAAYEAAKKAAEADRENAAKAKEAVDALENLLHLRKDWLKRHPQFNKHRHAMDEGKG